MGNSSFRESDTTLQTATLGTRKSSRTVLSAPSSLHPPQMSRTRERCWLRLPNLRHAFPKLQVPKFYWFSGIGSNRLHNPCMQLARTLPNLRVMTITLHPAGLTNHRWAEREMLEMERTNLEGSKERILLPLGEVPTAQPMHAVGPYTR